MKLVLKDSVTRLSYFHYINFGKESTIAVVKWNSNLIEDNNILFGFVTVDETEAVIVLDETKWATLTYGFPQHRGPDVSTNCIN